MSEFGKCVKRGGLPGHPIRGLRDSGDLDRIEVHDVDRKPTARACARELLQRSDVRRKSVRGSRRVHIWWRCSREQTHTGELRGVTGGTVRNIPLGDRESSG